MEIVDLKWHYTLFIVEILVLISPSFLGVLFDDVIALGASMQHILLAYTVETNAEAPDNIPYFPVHMSPSENLSHNKDKSFISDLRQPVPFFFWKIMTYLFKTNFQNSQMEKETNLRNFEVVESKWLTGNDFTSFCELECALLKKGLLNFTIYQTEFSVKRDILPSYHWHFTFFFQNSCSSLMQQKRKSKWRKEKKDCLLCSMHVLCIEMCNYLSRVR